MPRIPKWFGDLSEKLYKNLVRNTIVTEVDYYDTKELKRIRFKGDSLKSVDWKPAQEVEFRVSDTEFRHYTPSVWNSTKGYVDMIFYLHGKGPGSEMMDKLEVGDKIWFFGARGKFVIDSNVNPIVMLGDETTLSAFYGMQKSVDKDTKTLCVLEMNKGNLDWHSKIGLEAITLESIPGKRGEVLLQWIQDYQLKTSDYKKHSYYLSGHSDTIVELRKFLMSCGVKSKNIKTKPYWKKGKPGL